MSNIKLKATEWTISSLSVEFKMDKRRVGQMLEGLKPHRIQGNRQYFYFRDVIDHLMSNGEALDPSQESAKLNQARREKVEMETRIMRGELCDTNAVRDLWADVVGHAKSRLLGLAHKVAHQVIGMEYADAVEVIDKEVKQALSELESTDGAPESVQIQEDE